MFRFFPKMELQNFEIASDAFQTFKVHPPTYPSRKPLHPVESPCRGVPGPVWLRGLDVRSSSDRRALLRGAPRLTGVRC